MEINPRVVFERMFGWESTKDQRLARMRADRSVLDVVTEDLSDLTRAVGRRDRTRLDEYLANVRETERRIQQAEKQAGRELTVPTAPIGVPESFEDHASLMFDLLALAFETDQTRVFTFMLCREFSVRTYPNLGVTDPHHTVSHTQNRPALIAAHTKVNTYHVQLFARFLERLRVDAGRRRLVARPLDDSLRQRHGRREHPHAVAAADCGRRWHSRAGEDVTSSRRRRRRCRICCWRWRIGSVWICPSFGVSTGAVSL